MIGQPVLGASYLLRGLRLLTAPGLKRFVILPLSINVVVFALLFWLAADQFSGVVHYLMSKLPEWLNWLQWVLWPLFWTLAAALLFFSFSIIANLIASPFNSLLAEAVERHLTGQAPPGSSGVLTALKETPAALLDELRKLLYYAKWAIPLLLLFIVPVANLAAPLLWTVFSAWMLAVEYGDYAMGNHGLRGAEQRQTLASHRLLALGFGGLTLFATLIPVINFLVMPAAVAGATGMWVERLRFTRDANNHSLAGTSPRSSG